MYAILTKINPVYKSRVFYSFTFFIKKLHICIELLTKWQRDSPENQKNFY